MSSLQILEGVIGTGCAVACLYYARQGHFATEPPVPSRMAQPWHSALGEYARKNPFAATFGALALGFLISSWSMYISPHAVVLTSPRTVERWHTITRTVAKPDPAQAVKLASLQATITSDATTIAGLRSEIDRLNQLLSKRTASRRTYGAPAKQTEMLRTAIPEETRPATLGVAAANPGAAAMTAPAPSSQGTAITPGNPPAATGTATPAPASAPPANSPAAVPH